MSETCDLCHSSAVEPIYEPLASRRGLTVYLCSDCGLLQSLPRDRTARGGAAASRIADQGNIHSDKALRAEACLSLIRTHVGLDSSLCVLYTGSNRGIFARAIAAASDAILTCIEPDEDIRPPEAGFDVVHCCGAIEECVSPTSTLADYWRALKPDGLLVIDALNVALIDSVDFMEEWFIDSHLYHFSQRTIARLLEVAGFEIIAGSDSQDRENLLLAARKRKQPTGSVARDPAEVDAALALITSYVSARVSAQRAA